MQKKKERERKEGTDRVFVLLYVNKQKVSIEFGFLADDYYLPSSQTRIISPDDQCLSLCVFQVILFVVAFLMLSSMMVIVSPSRSLCLLCTYICVVFLSFKLVCITEIKFYARLSEQPASELGNQIGFDTMYVLFI